jgi:hypothetical protein
MIRLVFLLLLFSTFQNGICQFEDTPLKKEKRVKDATRFRHFAIESNIANIVLGGINLGFTLRSNKISEFELNGTYNFGYYTDRNKTTRINNNFYLTKIKKNKTICIDWSNFGT